jgi:hypothetical protein
MLKKSSLEYLISENSLMRNEKLFLCGLTWKYKMYDSQSSNNFK